MHNQRVIIIGETAAELYAVRRAIEESGVLVIPEHTSVEILEMQESIRVLESMADECEPLHFKDYSDDSDLKLELDDKPIHFNRKPVINYPKPIFKPRFIRRGNRGK